MPYKTYKSYTSYTRRMNHRIWAKILLVGTLLAPLTLFVYRYQTVYPLIFLKTFVFQIIVEILFLIWLALILWYPEYRPNIKALHIIIALWIALLVVSAIAGVNTARSFWSTQDRTTGIVFILHVFVFSLILQTVAKRFGWRKFMLYLASIGAGMAGMAIINHLTPNVFFAIVGVRPGGTLGNPSFLAGYLLFMIGITAWLFATQPPISPVVTKRTYWFSAFLGISAIIVISLIYTFGIDDVFDVIGMGIIVCGLYHWLSQTEARLRIWYRASLAVILVLEVFVLFLADTRGALLALVVGLLVLLFWYSWQSIKTGGFKKAYQHPASIILLLIIVFGVVFTATRSAPLWQSIPGFDRLAQLSAQDATVNNRRIVWGIALTSFKEKPILGWGTDNFRYAFDLHYDPILMRAGADEAYWDKPHNVFLESLVTTGILGFAAYIGIYILLLFALYRYGGRFKPFGFAILTAYAVQNFVIFDTFGTYLMFFICIAFIADMIPARQHPILPTPRTVSKVAAVFICSIAVAGCGWLLVINATTIYGNTLQYNGLNYFFNRLPDDAVASYKKGFALSYPYTSEIWQSYISALKQVIGQIDIPHLPDDIQLAIDEFPNAIVQDPNNHFLYYSLADARTAFYRIDKKFLIGAQEEIDTADTLSPHRQQIYYVRSRIKLALGDTAGGIAEMQKAVDLAPEVSEPHFYHAIISVGTASIDAINQELVLALDLGYQPKSLQELKLLHDYFLANGQYALGSDYFSEINESNTLRLEQELDRGELAFKATQFDVARYAFQTVKNEFSVFLLTNRFMKDYKQMFDIVGIATE